MTFEPAAPGNLSIVKASQYLAPPADEEPLRTILKNANWLYADHDSRPGDAVRRAYHSKC